MNGILNRRSTRINADEENRAAEFQDSSLKGGACRVRQTDALCSLSLSLRETSGERAGERGFLFLWIERLLSPALSSFLRQEERESASCSPTIF